MSGILTSQQFLVDLAAPLGTRFVFTAIFHLVLSNTKSVSMMYDPIINDSGF